MSVQYLSRPQVAARLGVARDTLNGYALPEPDVMVGRLPGWSAETIDAWHAARPGRGNWRAPAAARAHRRPDAASATRTRTLTVRAKAVRVGDFLLADTVRGYASQNVDSHGQDHGFVMLNGAIRLGPEEPARVERTYP